MRSNPENKPIYEVIFSDLCDQIIDGKLVPGEILPSENELCARYETSRETVRKGLKRLEQEKLIYSKPRRGYFVGTPHRDEIILSLPENMENAVSRFKDIKIIEPAQDVQEALEIPAGHRVIAIYSEDYAGTFFLGIRIKYVPYDKGYPSIEDEINFAVFPDAADAKRSSFSYYTQLRIQAVTAPEEILHLLKCGKDEPLMLISGIDVSQTGSRIGYTKRYLLSSYGVLSGTSGFVYNK